MGFVRTRYAGSIWGVRVVELLPVRCFPGTDADLATLPGGNWLVSHQRSVTLHRWLVRWSLFGNVQSPSPKFLCQLRFLSDTRCTDFWYQDCGVLWVFVQFVSPRIKECTFTSANHIIRAACAKVLSNVYQLIHICNMSDQQFIFHPDNFSWLSNGISYIITARRVLSLKSLIPDCSGTLVSLHW